MDPLYFLTELFIIFKDDDDDDVVENFINKCFISGKKLIS